MYSESPSEQKPIKNFRENGAWAYTGSAQIFCVPPIISETDKAAKLQIWQVYSQGPFKQKPFKILAKKMERGRIQGLPKFFEYPLLSQEWVKLRTSNFVRTLLVSIGTKVHYKFVEKKPGA